MGLLRIGARSKLGAALAYIENNDHSSSIDSFLNIYIFWWIHFSKCSETSACSASLLYEHIKVLINTEFLAFCQ